jgi:hexokinase
MVLIDSIAAAGLQDPESTSTQIPSFVTKIPDGSEKGIYLAADLGGTNFRVSIVQLHGDSTYNVKQSKVAIPSDLLVTESWKPLFAFLANHIYHFLQANDPNISCLNGKPRNEFRRLGFTFSFTVHQTSINTGTLIRWDKGFDIPSAIRRDPCQMLQEELDALRAPVLVTALVNDSVATYMAQQYVCDGRAVLGGIFGTGTNGAYLDDLAAVGRISSSGKTAPLSPPNHVVINTEWGGFDDHAHLLPTVQYDLDLDKSSLHPGEQRYEKMLSGMYLGELFRRAVLAAFEHDFRHLAIRTSSPLFQPWQIQTSLLSLLAEDSSDGHAKCREELLSAFELESLTLEEVQGIRTIAAAISKRAARLAGIAISAVVLKTEALQSPSSQELPVAKPEPSLVPQGNSSGTTTVFTQMYRLLSTFARPWPSFADLQRCMYWKGDRLSPEQDKDDKNYQPIYIGLDGTLAALLPGFTPGIRSTFRDVAGIGEEGDRRIRITLLQDASSVGTALVAQAAG